ncbi:MAG: ferritin-like domain-containing protein [Proteobacteria bacterium]|nr:ferritin-like domain-containing protein [Pseudomonadota bacterium]
MKRVFAEWQNRVRAEYRSAAITAGVLHRSIAVGIPRELLDKGQRIVADELDHAELSHACLVALGGPDEPPMLDVAQLQPSTDEDGVLAGLVDAIVQSFCLGETFAVPLFAAMREGCSHPAVEPMITRVLRDETVHRQFGWDMLDVLLAIDEHGVRDRAAARLPRFIQGYRRAYGEPPAAPEVTATERSMGLIPAAVYKDVFHDTLESTITPWFARRGIVWEAL